MSRPLDPFAKDPESPAPARVRSTRVFEDDEMQVLVTEWTDGEVEVAYRPVHGVLGPNVWGPPLRLIGGE